ncbi:MAG: tetratricopeptide repeat protein, partial [Bacteroidia bacterium]|nr:tetratricopeptide repeat protein [Bacteroidia bacterium]
MATKREWLSLNNNIGYIYGNQGDIPRALEFFSKSLNIREEIGDKKGMAGSYNNIGAIYDNQGDIPRALEFYSKSLKIQEEIADKKGMAGSYNNIGAIYGVQASEAKSRHDMVGSDSLINKALEFFSKSLKIYEEIG